MASLLRSRQAGEPGAASPSPSKRSPGGHPAGGAEPELRRHARRVAVSVALASLVVYVLAAAAVDVVVLAHLRQTTTNRLRARLEALATTSSTGAAAGRGDPDDAPIFAWRVQASAPGGPSPITLGSPPLGAAAARRA